MWDAPIGLVDGGDATRQSIFQDAIQYNAIPMQPMAQCNTPHRSLQCNTLRYTTVRFDPLCVNATLISQIHTCGAILLPQWQYKCNQI